MSTPDHLSPQPSPLSQTLARQVESYAREEPLKATSAAFGAGILLALLPIGGILSFFGRVLFLLLRPLLMILGVVKLVEHFDIRPPSEPHE